MFENFFKKKQQIQTPDFGIAPNNLKSELALNEEEIQICIELEFKRRFRKSTLFQSSNYFTKDEYDPLIAKAAEIIVNEKQGSASLLQRKLKLGYNQAGRLIDQLEYLGIIGKFEGSKSREVNIENLAELESIFETGEFLSKNCKLFRDKYLNFYEDQITQSFNVYNRKLEEDLVEKERNIIKLEILETENRKREKERLKTLRREIEKELSEAGEIYLSVESKREPIPQNVMDKVWNRDGGKCVLCGKSEKLEFDHIIPFSKVGSNTYRNIQLLCENCNRVKSNNIG